MSRERIRALLRKELLDLARNPTALVPVAIITVFSLVLPFLLTVAVPAFAGRGLGEDAGLLRITAAAHPPAALSDDARVQFFLFEQFLVLFLLTPVTGALVLAAHAVVGEKQARALEPLLATPITTIELLAAKLFGAAIPTFAISFAGLALYAGGMLTFGEPGVALAMINVRSLLLVLWLAPAAGLVSLQSAVLISSRVSDPRTAQQWGVLIIAPLSGLFIAQLMGSLWFSAKVLAVLGLGLLVGWILLLLFSVAIFERETILTRWT